MFGSKKVMHGVVVLSALVHASRQPEPAAPDALSRIWAQLDSTTRLLTPDWPPEDSMLGRLIRRIIRLPAKVLKQTAKRLTFSRLPVRSTTLPVAGLDESHAHTVLSALRQTARTPEASRKPAVLCMWHVHLTSRLAVQQFS